MASIKIAAISRAGIFSPNHVGNDAAILHSTVEQLRRRGCEVRLYNEEQFLATDVQEEIILDMCRTQSSLEKLQHLEDEGRLVINSGYAIENCTREKMTRLLLSNGIPYPDSIIVDTDADAREQLRSAGFERCWVKRGEFHAIHHEDVAFCRHADAVQDMLHEFFYRGIRRAVINRHLDGDLVKFYGLADDSFFYWFYPLECHHSKYGDEQINGAPRHLGFDEGKLRRECLRAAEVTGVKFYGGDCIIDSDGSFRIIDFNDWPSFAPCRDEAPVYIAKSVMNMIRSWQRGRAAAERRGARRKEVKE